MSDEINDDSIQKFDKILESLWSNWTMGPRMIFVPAVPIPGFKGAVARLLFKITRLQFFARRGYELKDPDLLDPYIWQ